MDIQALKTKYASLIAEAKGITNQAVDGVLSKELSDKATALLGQADELKAQIVLGERVAEGETYSSQPAGTQAAHLGFRPSGPDEGNQEIDAKAWRSFKLPVMGKFGVEEKEVRYYVPMVVEKKGYDHAFESFIRNGKDNLGPNDRKALSEATDSAGGFLVPEDWQSGIIKKAATMATVRQFARVVNTSRDIARWPRIKYTTNNEYTSGVRLTWTGETPAAATTARVTDQVFGEFAIPVHTAMASQLISMDLIEDQAYDVVGISSALFGEAFALGENDVFWNGHGAGQPRGIVTDAGDTTNFDVYIRDTDAASTIVPDEIIDVCYGLPAQYDRGARWFFTKATEAKLRKLTDTDGNYIWPVWPQVGNLGPVGDILGYPITRDEFVPEADSDGVLPIIFGDLSAYIVVDRVGLSIARNDSLYSETNQVLLLGRKRVGGQLVEGYKLAALRYQTST